MNNLSRNTNDTFSMNQLFKLRLGLKLTPVEYQFLSFWLKRCAVLDNLPVLKKRRENALNNNQTSRYYTRYERLAVALLLEHRNTNMRNLSREYQKETVYQLYSQFVLNS